MPVPVPSPPSKQRPWWLRIHLSTCVVLMLVAGGIIGMNFYPNSPTQYRLNTYKEKFIDYYGWPIAIGMIVHFAEWNEQYEYDPRATPDTTPEKFLSVKTFPIVWFFLPCFLNIGCCLGLLILVGLLCEYGIRLRALLRSRKLPP